MENLIVPEVNPARLHATADALLFKSPNCVSVGVSIALKASSLCSCVCYYSGMPF